MYKLCLNLPNRQVLRASLKRFNNVICCKPYTIGLNRLALLEALTSIPSAHFPLLRVVCPIQMIGNVIKAARAPYWVIWVMESMGFAILQSLVHCTNSFGAYKLFAFNCLSFYIVQFYA